MSNATATKITGLTHHNVVAITATAETLWAYGAAPTIGKTVVAFDAAPEVALAAMEKVIAELSATRGSRDTTVRSLHAAKRKLAKLV